MFLGSALGRLSSMVAANGDSMASMSSGDGWPVTSRMRSIWFIVEVPGNMGRPPSSSPRMHPADHMSTPNVYLVLPSKISGARYHRVAT